MPAVVDADPKDARARCCRRLAAGTSALLLALGLTVAVAAPAHAAVVTTDAELMNAITANEPVIELDADIVLGAALPPITWDVTIDGRGHTLDLNSLGDLMTTGTVVIRDLRVENPSSVGIDIALDPGETAELARVTVVSGYRGLMVSATGPGANLSVVDSTFTDADYNGITLILTDATATLDRVRAVDSLDFGMAANLYGASELNVTDSTFDGNAGIGATVATLDDSEVHVTGSTFSHNADGGLWAYLYHDTVGSISHSTVSNDGGWALWAGEGDFARFEVHHTTVTGNYGNVALGLEDLTAVVSHSIIAGNPVPPTIWDEVFVSAIIASATFEWNMLGGVRNNAAAGVTFGAGNIVDIDDPELGALADNGGPTQTHMLLAGSPARDAGNPAIAGAPATDQRGSARILGGRIDIGSVEATPVLAPTGVDVAPSLYAAGLLLLSGLVVTRWAASRRRART